MENIKNNLKTSIYFVVTFLITIFFLVFVAQRTNVEGNSMNPYLQNGDSLIVEKLSYRFNNPKRFDIVVFPRNINNGYSKYLIKRVIGLPGETVQISEDGYVLINDVLLEDLYAMEPVDSDKIGVASQKITLGEDEYFVLGDNRNNSSDSRLEAIGNVKKKDILGKAFLRIWPLNAIKIM